MTPRALAVYARARGQYLRQRHELTEGYLYTLAALVRSAVWSKRGLPPPEQVFRRERPSPMSDEAMFRQVQALNRLLGGEEK